MGHTRGARAYQRTFQKTWGWWCRSQRPLSANGASPTSSSTSSSRCRSTAGAKYSATPSVSSPPSSASLSSVLACPPSQAAEEAACACFAPPPVSAASSFAACSASLAASSLAVLQPVLVAKSILFPLHSRNFLPSFSLSPTLLLQNTRAHLHIPVLGSLPVLASGCRSQ